MKYLGGIVFLLLAACAEDNQTNESNVDHQFQTVVEDLKSPWNIEHHQDVYYISERAGSLVSWSESEGIQRFSIETDKDIEQRGEGGFLGFTFHPELENNILAYHTYQENGTLKNRIILLEQEKNKWTEKEVILDGIPGAPYHNGGRMELGPDGKLYVTTGDASDESLSQDQKSLAGKILRMNVDGSAPDDNPIEGSYVYSYGHRNPQGLAWNEEGTLFSSEHGPNNHDEINIIEPGNNYGWPRIVGEETMNGMERPLYQTGSDTWAPSGIAALGDELYVANLRGEALRRISQSGEDPEVVTGEFGRIRDVTIVDGEVLFITNNTDGRGSTNGKDDLLARFQP